MPNGTTPFGYRLQFLGSATSYDGLNLVSPQEASTPEGSLMLMELDFSDFPTSESVESLNKALLDKGVPPWVGSSRIVYADTTRPVLYLQWMKGLAWMPIIIGMLVLTVLPALLGAIVWWLIPEEVKQMISALFMMGILFLMMQFVFPMIMPKEEPKRIERRAE